MLSQELTQLIYHFFHHLSLQPDQINLHLQDNHLSVELTPPPSLKGVFIGYHAHTLDSLQLIITLIVNQYRLAHHQPKLSLTLDVAGYRQARLQTLIAKAEALAQKVLATHTPQPLPHLSPTERRQLHLYFKSNDAITTYSQGEGVNRQLFLAPQA